MNASRVGGMCPSPGTAVAGACLVTGGTKAAVVDVMPVGADVGGLLCWFDDSVAAAVVGALDGVGAAVVAGAIGVAGMMDGVCGLVVSGTKMGTMGATTPMVVVVGAAGGGQAGREMVFVSRVSVPVMASVGEL